MKTWLYRVLENDEEGAPLDFGAVRAETEGRAWELVEDWLRHGLWQDEDEPQYSGIFAMSEDDWVDVLLYPQQEPAGEGLFDSPKDEYCTQRHLTRRL